MAACDTRFVIVLVTIDVKRDYQVNTKLKLKNHSINSTTFLTGAIYEKLNMSHTLDILCQNDMFNHQCCTNIEFTSCKKSIQKIVGIFLQKQKYLV